MTNEWFLVDAVETTVTPDATASWIAALPQLDEPPQTRITLLAEIGVVACGRGNPSRPVGYSPMAEVQIAIGRTQPEENEMLSGRAARSAEVQTV